MASTSGARTRAGAIIVTLLIVVGVVGLRALDSDADVDAPRTATPPWDVFAFGDARVLGSTGPITLTHPIAGIARTPGAPGYDEFASNGSVYSFGAARFFGSTNGVPLSQPVVGMAVTPSGGGYWLVTGSGAIFNFGDAAFHGSLAPRHLKHPVVGIAATPSGRGYWLVTDNGAVTAFGDAVFHGAAARARRVRPIVGIAATPSGRGYWLVADDGAVYAYGNAPFVGSAVGSSRGRIITGIAATPSGHGYWLAASDGAVYAYGDAPFRGSVRQAVLGGRSIVGIISSASGRGYALVAARPPHSSARPAASHTSSPVANPGTTPNVCGAPRPPPTTYRHVVVIMEENRTWSQVGGPGFGGMPYAHALATKCTSYRNWLETDATQDSLPQYVGLTSGVDNHAVWNDCTPSATCRSTDDNIFRQVRDAGGTARTFVEGATRGCDGATHGANVPALYYFGDGDHAFCTKEVRPLTEMHVDRLPTFSMIIPNRCNNGHNCGNDVVDAWLHATISKIVAGASYRSGSTAVFVVYDEDRPMPNLIIAPTAQRGEITNVVATHSEALRTFDELLGLPVLPSVRHVSSLRASAHI